MKKVLVVAFGLMSAVLLSACGNKDVVDNWGGGKALDGLQGSVSLTMEELDTLQDKLFPISYAYTTYLKEDGSISDTWEYVYIPEDEYLLPIEKYIVSKEVSSSEIQNGLIYSMVDATLDGWDMVSILYINDPETLKYSFATVYGENETTLYTFRY